MLICYNPHQPQVTMRQPAATNPLYLDPERRITLEPWAFNSPGVTEMDPKLFKMVVLDKPGIAATIQDMVDRGLVWLQGGGGVIIGGDIKKWITATKADVGFGDLSTTEAKAAIGNCMDIKQLKLWQGLNGLDKGILDALAERIKTLETPTAPDNQ